MLHECYVLGHDQDQDGARIVQSLSCVWLFATPWTAACQASLSITSSQSLHKLMSIELVMPSNHLILCRLLLLLSSIFPSIRVFSNESVLCIRWPEYWSFSFNIHPSSVHSGLIFRMDWLDLFAVQGTPKSLLQHHSSKASILQLLQMRQVIQEVKSQRMRLIMGWVRQIRDFLRKWEFNWILKGKDGSTWFRFQNRRKSVPSRVK